MFFSLSAIERFNTMSFHFIETEKAGHVFFITLNRPEQHNTFIPAMIGELGFALEYANLQRDIWCVVIRANGPEFCAGIDQKAFHSQVPDPINRSLPEPGRTITLGDAFRLMNKPVIAKVEGNVSSEGLILIGGCTFVIATDDSRFSLPEVKRGSFPLQFIATLQNFMGRKQALRLCILGETFNARAALNLGLVTHIAVRGDVNDRLTILINTILNNSPFAISNGITAFRAFQDIPDYAKAGFLIEQMEKIGRSADAQEGMAAFQENREPVWKNQ